MRSKPEHRGFCVSFEHSADCEELRGAAYKFIAECIEAITSINIRFPFRITSVGRVNIASTTFMRCG